MPMPKLLAPVLLSALLATSPAMAAETTKIYVFPNSADNRTAISNLAGIEGISIAGVTSGDTTLVNLGGNGFERGFLIDGLHASERQEFTYDGNISATPGGAAALDKLLEDAGFGPTIVIAPIGGAPPRCVYAECLPPGWNADKTRVTVLGFGPARSSGFVSFGGPGTSVGGGMTVGPGVTGGHVPNGTGVGGARPTIVGQGRIGGEVSGGFTVNGMGQFGGQDGGG